MNIVLQTLLSFWGADISTDLQLLSPAGSFAYLFLSCQFIDLPSWIGK